MYHYTTRNVHCHLWLQEKMHCKMSVQQVFFFYKTSTQFTKLQQTVTKIKNNKTCKTQNFSLFFQYNKKGHKHIRKMKIV